MRILYVSAPVAAERRGGIQRYEREVGDAIAGRGHQVRWLRCPPAAALAYLTFRDRIPTRAYWTPFYFWRRNYVEDYRFHRHMARLVRRECASFAPDIVHSFHLYNTGALAAPCPVSVSCHGLEVQAIPPVVRMLQRVAGVHAVSSYTASRAQQIAHRDVEPLVLSWGVRPREPRAGDKLYDLITVSRLVRRKNVDTVLRALARLPPLRYVIVGDGPERAPLEALADSLGLGGVEFVGEVPDDRLHELLDRSRQFVMVPRGSAEDFEGLGIVYYEAHGHGLPVVASSTGGIPDAVGDAGILVETPDDPAAVARAIEAALGPRFAELTARVLARQRTHSWERFIDAFERWHVDVAGEAARPAGTRITPAG